MNICWELLFNCWTTWLLLGAAFRSLAIPVLNGFGKPREYRFREVSGLHLAMNSRSKRSLSPVQAVLIGSTETNKCLILRLCLLDSGSSLSEPTAVLSLDLILSTKNSIALFFSIGTVQKIGSGKLNLRA
jgi:hypothetical protein